MRILSIFIICLALSQAHSAPGAAKVLTILQRMAARSIDTAMVADLLVSLTGRRATSRLSGTTTTAATNMRLGLESIIQPEDMTSRAITTRLRSALRDQPEVFDDVIRVLNMTEEQIAQLDQHTSRRLGAQINRASSTLTLFSSEHRLLARCASSCSSTAATATADAATQADYLDMASDVRSSLLRKIFRRASARRRRQPIDLNFHLAQEMRDLQRTSIMSKLIQDNVFAEGSNPTARLSAQLKQFQSADKETKVRMLNILHGTWHSFNGATEMAQKRQAFAESLIRMSGGRLDLGFMDQAFEATAYQGDESVAFLANMTELLNKATTSTPLSRIQDKTPDGILKARLKAWEAEMDEFVKTQDEATKSSWETMKAREMTRKEGYCKLFKKAA